MKKALLLSIVLLSVGNLYAAVTAVSNAPDLGSVRDQLKSGVIETLYYGESDFSPALKELIETRDNEEQLIDAFYALDEEQVNLRHTVLIVLIKKQQKEAFASGEMERAQAVLVSALKDDHFWIRTEAVWGLRYFGDSSLMRRIAPLIDDSSEYVRKEAQETLVELYELYQDRTDNVF